MKERDGANFAARSPRFKRKNLKKVLFKGEYGEKRVLMRSFLTWIGHLIKRRQKKTKIYKKRGKALLQSGYNFKKESNG